MNLQYITGDITKPKIPPNDNGIIIAHCCNDVGLFGAGVALAIRRKWPEVAEKYYNFADSGLAYLGQVQMIKVEPKIIVCNIIGQRGVGNQKLDGQILPPIRYEAIYEGLLRIRTKIKMSKNMPISIHAPRFGTKLAGGNWDDIFSCINKVFSNMDIDIYIYDFEK